MKAPQRLALGYLRVSTEEQAASGLGLDAQRATITLEAQRRGWDIEFVCDAGGSGAYVNPGLRPCLERLADRSVRAMVVAKMDRLSRSVANAADILNAARAQGWDLVVCDLGVDLSTPQGRAMGNMLATFAELERDLISQRTKEGLAAARARGIRIGRPRLVSDDVAKRICNARDSGETFGAIARALADQGLLSPAGKPTWQPSTVRRIYNATKEHAWLSCPTSSVPDSMWCSAVRPWRPPLPRGVTTTPDVATGSGNFCTTPG